MFFIVHIVFGPLGLPPFHQIARVPATVIVHVLDDAELHVAGRT